MIKIRRYKLVNRFSLHYYWDIWKRLLSMLNIEYKKKRTREYLPLAVNMLTNSPKALHITKRDFTTQAPANWWKNLVKHLSCRFQQCLGPFIMFILEECCETGILKIHLTTCFTIHKFGNTGALRVFFFFKMFKIWCRFQKSSKTSFKRSLFLRELHFNCLS